MDLIFRVARKEVTEILRDRRFRWAFATVLALLATAAAAGVNHYQEVARTHQEAGDLSRKQWLSLGERNPHSAAHFGIYVFRPTSPLAFFDRGVDPYVGVTVWLEAHWQNPFGYQPVRDRSALARFGDLTPAGTLQIVLPLLVILFAFSAFTGERESGTLRQALGQGVSPTALAWGKCLGLAGCLLLLGVPAVLFGLWALALTTAVAEIQGLGVRLLLLSSVYLAYLGAFLLLALSVSAVARSSRVALVILLSFWVANTMVSAPFAAGLSRWLHPLPGTTGFHSQIRNDLYEGFEGHPPLRQKVQLLRDSLLVAHGVRSLEELPLNFAGIQLQASEDYGNMVFDHHFGELARTVRTQAEFQRRLGVLFPFLAVRSASMAFAGSDVGHLEDFRAAAEAHRREIQRLMNHAITVHSRYGEVYQAGPELWEAVPEFRYRGPGPWDALREERTSVLVLLLWLVAPALLLGFTAPRMRA